MNAYKKIIILTLVLGTLFVIHPMISAETATSEGESVLQKIKEKVETIRQNPKAFIGTVTDKTESSLQIKDLEGKIQQISVKDGVAIVKTGKTNTDIKFSDVAIGDYIVAMGFSSSKNILDAKRILLTSPVGEPVRKIIFGKITKIDKKVLTIIDSSNEEFMSTFLKSWKGPEIKELDEGINVLEVTVPDNGKQTVRTIEIIKTGPTNSPSASPRPNKSN